MGRKKTIVLSILIIIAIIFLKTLFYLHLDPSSEEFVNVDFCPACYGSEFCPQFYHGDVSLIGISKLKYLKNSKNVFYGKLSQNRVILKKLAHDSELADMDKLLCKKAERVGPCKVNEAILSLIKNSSVTSNISHLLNLINLFDKSTDLSHCFSKRLMSYIFNKLNIKPRHDVQFEQIEVYKLSELLYNFLLNPEAVILQAFPQTEGWPFPRYYGSCGRVIVEEYAGRTIAYFEDSPWLQRIDIAYQLLLIAQTLTENSLEFALYMTDVNMDNFAVRPDGTVLLIDVESIVIVDRLVTRKDEKHYTKFHHSKGEFCKDCLNFSYEDLCTSDQSDHNYYAICKGLLVPKSYFSAKGFLHDIPEEVNVQTNLSLLLEECANPSKTYNRFHIVPKILQVMKSLL